MTIARTLLAVAAVAALASSPLAADPKPKESPRKLTWTTKSEVAKQKLAELQRNVETFQGRRNQELVKEILAADPEFALGHYYASAVTFPPDLKELETARELAKKASDGERRFIEALVLARSPRPSDGIEPLLSITRDFPGERVPWMILGQIHSAEGRVAEARAAFQQAIALDATTPRAHTLMANLYLLEGEYARARATLEAVIPTMPAGAPPVQARYAIAFSHLYEGNPDAALATLRTMLAEYKTSGAAEAFPEVFIWNSIARVNLENGRLEEAMKAYEAGFESVPGSSIDEQQKQIWDGRLRHGRARTLARMGRYEEAWAEAETIRKMIEGGGEAGQQFVPAWHYLAGYVKLEAGDIPAALEHLKQANPQDPFHRLLLGRAYEKAGDKENARKAYQEVVDSRANGLERALAYPEARKKLATL